MRAAVRKRTGANGSSKSAAQDRSAKRWQSSNGSITAQLSPELTKYLQEHFAGARTGLELARRLVEREPGSEVKTLADEIELDRTLLKQVMEALEVPFGPVKQASAWLGGKFVQFRPTGIGNGSALGELHELEALSLGVEGKALLWQALIEIKDLVPRLAASELAPALLRARGQRKLLETLRLQAVRAVATS